MNCAILRITDSQLQSLFGKLEFRADRKILEKERALTVEVSAGGDTMREMVLSICFTDLRVRYSVRFADGFEREGFVAIKENSKVDDFMLVDRFETEDNVYRFQWAAGNVCTLIRFFSTFRDFPDVTEDGAVFEYDPEKQDFVPALNTVE